MVVNCSGNAFAIICIKYQALKNRYDSNKTKDLAKATTLVPGTKLEKCYMKSDTHLEAPAQARVSLSFATVGMCAPANDWPA